MALPAAPRDPSNSQAPQLITTQDVMKELHRLFDAGAESTLRIRVYGEPENSTAADSADAFREMLESLRMYDENYREGVADIYVDAPSRATIARALSILGHERHQKQILDLVLTTFGRRLIDPLAVILDTTPTGALGGRLRGMRDMFIAQLADLRMTPESQQIISDDLRKLLSDEYLAMLAEHEERVQRPRVKALAQRILRLIGSTFHQALKRWPQHAEQIASSISRRCQGKVRLRDIPSLLRGQITDGIEEFLWVETSNDIEGALQPLFAEHRSVMPVTPPPLDRSVYREFAAACWEIIAEYC